MEEFLNYKKLQLLLLSINDENDMNLIKKFIDENNLFSESLNLSTLRLISSVVYSRPNILPKIIKLLNKFDSISIKPDIVNDNLSDYEVTLRYSVILYLLFLIDNGKIKKYSITDLEAYTNYEYFNPYKNVRYNSNYSQDNDESIENMYKQMIKVAVAEGNMEMIDILSSKIYIESNSELIEQLLYTAILYMRNDLIDFLINKYSIKINAEAYIKCIYSSNYDALIKLKELDDKKAYNDYGIIGSTPLDIAAFEGYLDFFKFFLTFEDIDVKKTNSYGKNILHSATKYNKIEVIRYIIDNKIIDPNDTGNYNVTPLALAKDLENDELISYLSEYTSK